MEASAMTRARSPSNAWSQLGRHQADGLLGAVAAGRALAAAFVLEELHQVQRHGLHVVLVRQDHHGVAADKRAMLLELTEVERQIRP